MCLVSPVEEHGNNEDGVAREKEQPARSPDMPSRAAENEGEGERTEHEHERHVQSVGTGDL